MAHRCDAGVQHESNSNSDHDFAVVLPGDDVYGIHSSTNALHADHLSDCHECWDRSDRTRCSGYSCYWYRACNAACRNVPLCGM